MLEVESQTILYPARPPSLQTLHLRNNFTVDYSLFKTWDQRRPTTSSPLPEVSFTPLPPPCAALIRCSDNGPSKGAYMHRRTSDTPSRAVISDESSAPVFPPHHLLPCASSAPLFPSPFILIPPLRCCRSCRTTPHRPRLPSAPRRRSSSRLERSSWRNPPAWSAVVRPRPFPFRRPASRARRW